MHELPHQCHPFCWIDSKRQGFSWQVPRNLNIHTDPHLPQYLPLGEGANTVLAGVLRGCGRQRIGATINLGMYWGLGLPAACVLAFKMGMGAMGLWTGLACTASIQSLYLAWIVFK